MSAREPHENFIDPALLFGPLGVELDSDPTGARDAGEDADDVPGITRMPAGMEVIEHRVGRAVGTWILQVRCQCGRRWFEAEPSDATHCPRCGMFVYIDVQARGGPGR